MGIGFHGLTFGQDQASVFRFRLELWLGLCLKLGIRNSVYNSDPLHSVRFIVMIIVSHNLGLE